MAETKKTEAAAAAAPPEAACLTLRQKLFYIDLFCCQCICRKNSFDVFHNEDIRL